MKQIKTIRLQNFQSHKDTLIEADTNVLVLSGESNQGKTAILRGLMWLITNRPSGIGFVSKWAKEVNKKGEVVLTKTAMCSVSVTVVANDGKEHTLTRLRTRDKNVYEVDGVELEAVGTSVPDEVSALLGMHECNVQSQDDTYFMLTLPPGQVASKLNELVHLETIDKAYEYNKKGKLRCSALYKEWDGIVGEAKLQLDGLKHIPELKEDASDLADKIEDYNDLKQEITDMKLLLEDYYNRKKVLEVSTPDLGPDLDELTQLLESYEKQQDILSEGHKLLAIIDDLANKIKELPEIDEEDIQQVRKLIETHDEIADSVIELSQIKALYESNLTDLKRVAAAIEEAEKQLPKTCPTCGQPLDKEEL